MATAPSYDVIVVGGGIAGSSLAGVLARSGLGILVVEKEARFRDRIRGEGTFPWGRADALQLGLGDVLRQAGCVDHRGLQWYEGHRPASIDLYAPHSIDGLSAMGFSHPRLQETLFSWAAAQGATVIRPAKAISASFAGTPSVSVLHDGDQHDYSARLVVGADGKLSAARGWFGPRRCPIPNATGSAGSSSPAFAPTIATPTTSATRARSG